MAAASVWATPSRKFTSLAEKSSRRRLPAASTPWGRPCTPTGTLAALNTPLSARIGEGRKRCSASKSGDTTLEPWPSV